MLERRAQQDLLVILEAVVQQEPPELLELLELRDHQVKQVQLAYQVQQVQLEQPVLQASLETQEQREQLVFWETAEQQVQQALWEAPVQLGKVVLQEELDGLDLRVFQVLLEKLERLVSMAEQVQQVPMVLLERPVPRE